MLGDLVEGINNFTKKASLFFEEQPTETKQMFDHYFDRTGVNYDYPISKLRENKTIKEGEMINHNRLLNALIRPGVLRKKKYPSLVIPGFINGQYSLDDMRDGEAFGLDDYDDIDVNNNKAEKNGDDDLGNSLGSFKLRSKSNLQFIKSKDKILPYGYTEHSIKDVYDFNRKGDFLNKTFYGLEDVGIAKSYPVSASWKMQSIGVIKINDGKIDHSGVEWGLLR